MIDEVIYTLFLPPLPVRVHYSTIFILKYLIIFTLCVETLVLGLNEIKNLAFNHAYFLFSLLG